MADISLSSKLGFLVASLNKQLEKQIEERLGTTKLPIEQIRVLEFLAGKDAAGGLSMTQLARLIVIDASTLTKVIDRMVSDSLVYRAADPSDRRKVKVLIAENGVALYKKLRPLLRSQEKELEKTVKDLTKEEDIGNLNDILEALYDHSARPQSASKDGAGQ